MALDDDTADTDDGWMPVDAVGPQQEQRDLDDLDLVAEMTHPVRGVILRRLKQPRTVAEVADLLDVPITRLYHHVNRLVDAGLVQVVATRQVAAVTERRYQTVADAFGISADLLR
jgi:DNA-binding transcriptional ArsR family regulator